MPANEISTRPSLSLDVPGFIHPFFWGGIGHADVLNSSESGLWGCKCVRRGVQKGQYIADVLTKCPLEMSLDFLKIRSGQKLSYFKFQKRKLDSLFPQHKISESWRGSGRSGSLENGFNLVAELSHPQDFTPRCQNHYHSLAANLFSLLQQGTQPHTLFLWDPF